MDNKDKKERIAVPIICLLMSIGLWFYVSNVENTIRKYDMNKVPVELLNVESLKDSKLTLSPNQEFYVDLKLEGSNDIYKIKKEDFKIVVDISDYALKKGENKMAVNIVNAPSNITIKNTNNLNVVIKLEEISEKIIEIKSEIAVTAKQGYFVAKPEISPKEVKVIGPESMVEKVESVVVRGEADDASEDVIGEYALIPVDNTGKEVKDVYLQNKYAEVFIKVSKGRSVPVKINTTGELPLNLKLKSIEGSRKTIEIVGPKDLLDGVVELQTEPIDLSQINDSGEINVGIVVPEGVSLLPGEEFVTVKVNVIKVATKELDITFVIKGITQGFTITPAQTTVKVKVTAFEDQIDTVVADKIKAELNVESFKTEGTFEGTPIITLVGLDSSITVTPSESISFTISKEIVPPEVEVIPET